MKQIHTVTVEFKVEVSDTSAAFDPSNYHNYINDVEAQRAAGDLITLLVPTELGVSVVTVDTELELTDDERAAYNTHRDDDMAEHTARSNALEDMGDERGIKHTVFSMSDVAIADMDNPLLGLGDVYGKVRFIQGGDEFWGGDKASEYKSDVVINATMMDAWKAFDDSIEVTGDAHHIFLEGLQPVEMDKEGVLTVTFVTGS